MTDWALVTGASRGIGRAIALDLARVPFHVVVNYKSSTEEARSAVEEIAGRGGSAETACFDVADARATNDAVESLIARLGAPFAVINNAGIIRDGLMVWMKEEEWNDVISTNLGGFFHVTRPCLKSMLVARRGRVVNVTSTAGLVGNPGQVNYCASKAGLIGATKALAREVAKRGITINAVAPGLVESDMIEGLALKKWLGTIPAGRLGSPGEIAAVVRFLCSEEAAYITGQVIGVNGGLA